MAAHGAGGGFLTDVAACALQRRLDAIVLQTRLAYVLKS